MPAKSRHVTFTSHKSSENPPPKKQVNSLTGVNRFDETREHQGLTFWRYIGDSFSLSAQPREGFIVLISTLNLARSQQLSNIVLSANASTLHSNFQARGWSLRAARKYIPAAKSKTQTPPGSAEVAAKNPGWRRLLRSRPGTLLIVRKDTNRWEYVCSSNQRTNIS